MKEHNIVIHILNKLNKEINKNCFMSYYGSIVYGTNTKISDIDVIYVFDSSEDIYEVIEAHKMPEFYDLPKIDIHYISSFTFQKLLNSHDIMTLETYYQLPNDYKEWFNFELNLDTLRRKISAVVSNSWSKARKKLDIPEESDYIALKSLFHSLRILSYGINLAENNKIDYLKVTLDGIEMTCKELWEDILKDYNNGFRWIEFKEKYKPIQNANATKFRLLAPKELD
jgi:predicted nucleotidyltransferase